MLEIEIKTTEIYDSVNNEFITVEGGKLKLEHSLMSISKWESKYCKPFLTDNQRTQEELIDYIRDMCLDENQINMVNALTNDDMKKISDYISAPMTATTFSQREGVASRKSNKITTSEEIYYYMTALQIPFECQYWHFNRLMTLIHICSIKNQPPKKMSKRDIMKGNTSLNAARRKALHSSG